MPNPPLYSSSVITRRAEGPVLTAKDVPYASTLVFNAGVIKHDGKYYMIFRNDYNYISGTRFEGTNIGLAESEDGIHWQVRKEPCTVLEKDGEIQRTYDPRLTVIDDEIYATFAVDTRHGLRGGIARTKDLKHFDVLSLSVPDNRNMVLFPEKINGMYVRLERPMPVYSRDGDRFDIWISESPDLVYWGNSKLLCGVEDFPFADNKIGPGAPPIRTEKGWLVFTHTVDLDRTRGKNGWENVWQKRYCAGVMLLDLNDPSKVLGICRQPLIAPEADYETKDGFRTNVIFPTGAILEPDGQVKIYYGASDTVVALATADVNALVALCLSEKP